jgi:hypothetical protein
MGGVMRFLRCLLSPDGDGDGGGSPDASGSPPAAAVVAGGSLSESDAAELVRLRQEKESLGKLVKDRESRLAELEDENRQLKNPVPPAVVQKKGFLDGLAEYFPKVG